MCVRAIVHDLYQPAQGAGVMSKGLSGLAAVFAGQWLGTRMDGSICPLTHGMWFWSVLIALSAWTMVQRHGSP
ncbi:MAG: hypothetical protein KGN32_10405 [Burkholderiales bacterium]|nr:hypothetical protein [Burkholderiales bacterium]